MIKASRGVPSTVPITFDGEDGPLTLTAAPSVAVSGPDGLSVTTGTATGTAGAYTFSMPAQDRLGVYTVTASGTYAGVAITTAVPVEITGGWLFTVPAFRASDDVLTDAARFPTATVKDVRGMVTDEFYKITRRAFNLRGTIETVPVFMGKFFLERVEPYRIISATLHSDYCYGVNAGANTDTVVDVTTIGFAFSGECLLATQSNRNNVMGTITVEYEYGMTAVPSDVKRVALMRARAFVLERDSGIPDRATSFQSVDGGNFQLATAGRAGFETGIPEVDATLKRYSINPPGVA